MPFRHDAGIFRPNGVSRRNFDGLKTPNPSSFGDWGVIGKKIEAKNPNGVSAKCAIIFFAKIVVLVKNFISSYFEKIILAVEYR
jgi:hypothetical protein